MSIGLRLVLLASIWYLSNRNSAQTNSTTSSGVHLVLARRHLLVLLRQRGQLRERVTTGAGDSVVMGTKLDVAASEILCLYWRLIPCMTKKTSY